MIKSEQLKQNNVFLFQSLRIVTHTLDVKQHEMEAKMHNLGGNMETMVKQGLGNQMEGAPKILAEVCAISLI